MAAGSEVQNYLGLELNSDAKGLESDSDSGQGSCEMASPEELSNRMECLEEDSDDEIVVSKKSKNKKILVESDSEGEEVTATTVNEPNEESEEENKENSSGLKGKSGRIRLVLLNSDDSESEDETESGKTSFQHTPSEVHASTLKENKSRKLSKKQGGQKEDEGKVKSKRRMEKAEKRMASIGKLKKDKKKKSQIQLEEEVIPLNDSGCLLANGDLFENDVEDVSDPAEEESLDAIRATVIDKLKGWSSADYEDSDPEEAFSDRPDHGDKRKERKAARMSKEAIKQLHSETQRLIRESSVSLPYHLPEPKTIHDFFKRRARPTCQGSAMQLIKSTKYQPCNVKETTVHLVTHGSEIQKNDFADKVHKIGSECPLQEPNDMETADQEAEKKIIAEVPCEPTVTNDLEISTKTLPCEDPLDHTESVQRAVEQDENEIAEIPLETHDPQNENTVHQMAQDNESTSLTTTIQAIPKLSKLEKLRALGVDLSLKPRLCPDNGSFVNLDEPQVNKALEALKERFLKHTLHKPKPVAERKVNLTIVRKEATANGKEELKADVVPVTMQGEILEEQIHGKPGEKLQVLKAKLQEAMKLRRNEERQKRQALFNLDNEDGFYDEEEEAEMTESEEEEDGNAETAEYLLGEGGGDEDENEDSSKPEVLEKDLTEVSIPERRPRATEATLMLFKDHSTKHGDSLPGKMDHGDSVCKGNGKMVSEEEDSLLNKENSHNSSFELIGSMIPSYQPFNKNARGSLHSTIGGFRSPSPMHFKTSFLSSASKSSGKMSEPSLPVEDSQDLYNASPEPKASYLCAGGDSQFQFSLEDDTQSQLLDADGFLNVGHHRSKYSSAKHRLTLDTMDENAMDANMGELLDLCSGQFNDASQALGKENKEDAMEELLGLCSGKFASQTDTSTQNCSPSKSGKEPRDKDLVSDAAALCSGSFPLEREEEEEEEFGDFQLLPCEDSDSEKEDESNDEENNEGSDNEEKEASDEEKDSDEEELLRQHQKKKKLRLKDFMENEAELSGSDIDSGDEEEGDEDDEYEEEAIDEDLPSDEELQDQVNKIHMKVTMDEDQRKLRLYQERYLADGDLHSDGPGRMRKYRWKMFDDASQLDMFRRDSELEDQELDNEELDEADAKWRKERFEREQWLREQSSGHAAHEEEEEIGESSQFMKLAKKVTAKVLQRRATTETSEVKKPVSRNPFEVIRPFSNPNMKTGSLLNKPKEVLQKLAAMSDLNPNAPRNSRNFVFQTLSPAKKEESVDRPKAKVRKNIAFATPSPKRLKLDKLHTVKSNSRSIFPFLEN
ncbi:claspin isoform X1 [Pelobates cultripes]|uniref:Claspin isoform X1 n=1 Tax=Pelobates cultripes TaxID=61616 RepID=A0AAD1VMI2_PELCU|nr:claspin isoform X1 [Pelobates cultripes]